MKNSHNTSPARQETPNYRARRLGVLTIGLLTSLGILKASQMATHEVHAIGDRDHQVNEMGKFDHPLGSDRFSVEGVEAALRSEHVDPSKVTVYTVSPTESTPTKVAEDLHAHDTWLVASEVAGQSGGDRAMQAGEEVAIPNDQIAAQPTLVSKNGR